MLLERLEEGVRMVLKSLQELTDFLLLPENDPIRRYAISLFVDTRLNQTLSIQEYIEPAGFSELVEAVRGLEKVLPGLVGGSSSDTVLLGQKMSNTTDPIRRLALWADYIS